MRRIPGMLFAFLLVLACVVGACTDTTSPPATKSPLAEPLATALSESALQPLDSAPLDADKARPYLEKVSFAPQDAKYFDLVNQTLTLNTDEQAMLARQGFAVSDRTTWNRFIEAYAWIYWKDLPVLVTTDSILHTVHQSYNDLLKDLERTILIGQMNALLRATQGQVVVAHAANQNPDLDALYTDVDTYLAVAIALLNQQTGGGGQGSSQAVQTYVSVAVAADKVMSIDLFGAPRDIDFTLFTPRGHYAEEPDLQGYFRAMSWLAQIDFRFVEFDIVTSAPKLNLSQIAAAAILRQALDAAQQRAHWTQINQLFEVLVGRSDNMTLFDFDHFLSDAHLSEPEAILQADPAKLLTQLTTNDYGQQRITGQIIGRNLDNTTSQPMPRPVSFMLLGQRFGIDAYVMSNLVYDRLMKDGKPVERALPAPLDVMYALGNDRAVTHLTAELATYPYAGHLAALRQQIDGLDPSFWQAPIYNEWLGMIRTLATPTTDQQYPQTMRTQGWADKMLQTQLASWAQLRHDNILYVKQSFSTAQITCEYPAGYVEPYPAFYTALSNYAQSSHAALTAIDMNNLGESGATIQKNALQYFERIVAIAERLRTLAEKELRLENFTPEEEAFLKSIMVQQKGADFAGCGGPRFEDQWDGWYAHLFYGKDENPAVIADVHTNPTTDPTSKLYPPRVLHVASGPVAPIFFIVDTDEGAALYVGPAFSYFEVVTTGSETVTPGRLTDEAWQQRLQSNDYPAAPAWTSSFRLPTTRLPQGLALPMNIDEPTPTATQPAIFSPLATPTP